MTNLRAKCLDLVLKFTMLCHDVARFRQELGRSARAESNLTHSGMLAPYITNIARKEVQSYGNEWTHFSRPTQVVNAGTNVWHTICDGSFSAAGRRL